MKNVAVAPVFQNALCVGTGAVPRGLPVQDVVSELIKQRLLFFFAGVH